MKVSSLFLIGVTFCVMPFGCKQRVAEVEKLDEQWKALPPIVDPESRTEKLPPDLEDQRFDTSAYVGMPEDYRNLATSYIQAIENAIEAEPLTRRRFYHHNPKHQSPPYPDGCKAVFDREVIVPLSLLPRPEVVEKWSTSSRGRESGWQSLEGAFESLGSVYGRSIFFQWGEKSEDPFLYPATPIGETVGIGFDYLPVLDTYHPIFSSLGKVVAQPTVPRTVDRPGNIKDGPDGSKKLRLSEKDGAVFLGEIVTKPAFVGNSRVRLVKSRTSAQDKTFIGYAMIDGSGVKRDKWLVDHGSGLVSPYVRPLTCQLHQPRVLQHDLLLMPTPLPWPPMDQRIQDHPAHEEWCLDDWFPKQDDAVWVIRQTEFSSPLKENFELMPASQKSELQVFFVALFAETEPSRLVKELAALHEVSPDPVLGSEEVMQKLETHYRRITDIGWNESR